MMCFVWMFLVSFCCKKYDYCQQIVAISSEILLFNLMNEKNDLNWVCLNTANQTANQVEVTSTMPQVTLISVNTASHRRTLNSRKSVHVRISWTSYATYLEVLSSSWDGRPFGHNGHWPKIELEGLCPFAAGGAGSPSNAMWPGPRPTSVRNGISIHAAAWPQWTCGATLEQVTRISGHGGVCQRVQESTRPLWRVGHLKHPASQTRQRQVTSNK